jgi:hypothetical protein
MFPEAAWAVACSPSSPPSTTTPSGFANFFVGGTLLHGAAGKSGKVKTVLIEEGRRCYCPVDSIGAPKESGKPGDGTTTADAKRALKAIKEVRKFFAPHLPGIPEP